MPARQLDLGDLVVALLAAALEDLRDVLLADGYGHAAELVADLVEIADDFTRRIETPG